MYILTSTCASHHNGVHFFISHLASWLRTRRFSEPTFRPSRATNHWKNTVSRDFLTFSRICIFFLLTLSLLLFSLLIFLFSLPLPCSAFHLSILTYVTDVMHVRYVMHVYHVWNVCNVCNVCNVVNVMNVSYVMHVMNVMYVSYVTYVIYVM